MKKETHPVCATNAENSSGIWRTPAQRCVLSTKCGAIRDVPETEKSA
jgi:hypothetical protein